MNDRNRNSEFRPKLIEFRAETKTEYIQSNLNFKDFEKPRFWGRKTPILRIFDRRPARDDESQRSIDHYQNLKKIPLTFFRANIFFMRRILPFKDAMSRLFKTISVKKNLS